MRQVGGICLALFLLVSCGSEEPVAGFVIDVRSTSLTDIRSFTLRTPKGDELVFLVGRLELDGGAFPAGHLREHMALAQGVAVAYRTEAGERVAYRLSDAPWIQLGAGAP